MMFTGTSDDFRCHDSLEGSSIGLCRDRTSSAIWYWRRVNDGGRQSGFAGSFALMTVEIAMPSKGS